MNKLNFAILFIILSITVPFTTTAQAATLLEPYVGTHLNSTYTNESNTCTSSCSGSLTSSAVGGRLGFQNLGLMLGLNGKRAWYDFENVSDSLGEASTTTLGFFVGYDFPILLRAWFEYVISGRADWQDSDDVSWKVGSGKTFGIGYKVIPFVSLNLEFGSLKFTEQDAAGVATDIDVTLNTYMLSVSIPLSL